MTEPMRTAATKTFGRKNYLFIPAWSGYDAGTGPTVAEITASSGLDITRVLFADGAPAPSQSTNLVEQQRRWGDTQVSQFVGTTTHAGGTMDYALASQGTAGSDGVKLWELLGNGEDVVVPGFLVRRFGVARATTPAEGQFITGWKIECGPSLEIPKGDGENEEAGAQCTFAVLAPPVQRVAIVA